MSGGFAGLLIGLTPYIYLPVRVRTNPPMNWGNAASWQAFRDHVTRVQYGSIAPLRVEQGRSISRLGRQCAYMIGVVSADLSVPLAVLSACGLVLLGVRRDSLTLLVLLGILLCGVGFLIISNIDMNRTFRFAMEVLRCNYAQYWYAHDHALNMLASMLPNALVFPSGDHNTFLLMYMVMVAGQAPDVIIAAELGYIARDLHHDPEAALAFWSTALQLNPDQAELKRQQRLLQERADRRE